MLVSFSPFRSTKMAYFRHFPIFEEGLHVVFNVMRRWNRQLVALSGFFPSSVYVVCNPDVSHRSANVSKT